MGDVNRDTSGKRKRLGVVLTMVFLIAMTMGPGPGMRLINPDVESGEAPVMVFGVPIVYAWGVGCFLIQVSVIVTAYVLIWRKNDAGVG